MGRQRATSSGSLQGDQLRARHHAAKGLIEHVVSERGTEVADDDGLRCVYRFLQVGEVALDLVFMTGVARR
jgi:hypothetical protein